MRAADRDRPTLAARRADAGANRSISGFALASVSRSARTDDAAPDQPERGALMMRAAASVGYERQIDGEFVAAGDEFLWCVSGSIRRNFL